jgi:FKBP-type peptidyl-prolyl cis-trans isomerase
MNKILIFLCISTLLLSCSTEGVQSNGKGKSEDPHSVVNTNKEETSLKVNAANSDELPVNSTKAFKNGIVISWLKHGKGELIKKGNVISIDYKVTLQDGSVVDGNHLMKKKSFPFVVGFGMQTKGWDFALTNLKVGDFVRVKIPAELARGELGIKKEGGKGWFVPPNSVNYLTIRIINKEKPTRIVSGTKVWLFEENVENKLKFNKSNSIVFHCMISSESKPNYYNSYRTNTPYNLIYSDKGIIPGLKKALINAKKADRMFIIVPSSQAYGSQGSEGSVLPNEDLFYNVLVMDVLEK